MNILQRLFKRRRPAKGIIEATQTAPYTAGEDLRRGALVYIGSDGLIYGITAPAVSWRKRLIRRILRQKSAPVSTRRGMPIGIALSSVPKDEIASVIIGGSLNFPASKSPRRVK